MVDLQQRLRTLSARVNEDTEMVVWPDLIRRCDLDGDSIRINLDADSLAQALALNVRDLEHANLTFNAPFKTRKRGVETKVVIGATEGEIDQTLLRNVALGLSWYEEIIVGSTLQDLSKRSGVNKKRIRKLIELALLDPRIIEDIVSGHQPVWLTTEWLKKQEFPICWDAQRGLVASAK